METEETGSQTDAGTGPSSDNDVVRLLRSFNEIFEDEEKIEEIEEIIEDPDVDEETFNNQIPSEILAVTPLVSSVNYHMLRARIPDEHQEMADRAKTLFEDHIADIVEHPVAQERFQSMAQSQLQARATDGEEAVAEELMKTTDNRITSVMIRNQSLGTPPNLMPAHKVVFLQKKGDQDYEILFSSLLDWEDLVFVSERLIYGLLSLLNDNQSLVEENLIDLELSESVSRNLESLKDHLEALDEFKELYELDIG